ncbi:hypothetical protein HNP86_001783 [Methanococcus maripaludis]|uniref:Uncharacterized protein n=1 Tax=Methanococcus maripaludis TaxID=39152 RepID=A0A7J9NWI6_METMI|nr:hypothetical protein [Methanococcus maripaludis]MBA2851624.1 hypothetical protein [Methanococcus maripaludis]
MRKFITLAFILLTMFYCTNCVSASTDVININEYTAKYSFAGCYIHNINFYNGVWTFDILNTNEYTVTCYLDYNPHAGLSKIEYFNMKQFPIKPGNNKYRLAWWDDLTLGAYTLYMDDSRFEYIIIKV